MRNKGIVRAKLKRARRVHLRALLYAYLGLLLVLGFQNCGTVSEKGESKEVADLGKSFVADHLR